MYDVDITKSPYPLTEDTVWDFIASVIHHRPDNPPTTDNPLYLEWKTTAEWGTTILNSHMILESLTVVSKEGDIKPLVEVLYRGDKVDVPDDLMLMTQYIKEQLYNRTIAKERIF